MTGANKLLDEAMRKGHFHEEDPSALGFDPTCSKCQEDRDPSVVLPKEVRIVDSLTLYDDGTRLYLIPNRNPLRVDRASSYLLMHAAVEVIEKETGKILKHRYAKRVVQ